MGPNATRQFSDHELAKMPPGGSDEPPSGFVTSFTRASAMMMPGQGVVVMPAIFVHAAGIALARIVGLARHAISPVGVGSPVLTALTTDLVKLGRQGTMEVRRGPLAVRRIGATCTAHSVQEPVVPRTEQRVVTYVSRVAVTTPTRVARVVRRALRVVRSGRARIRSRARGTARTRIASHTVVVMVATGRAGIAARARCTTRAGVTARARIGSRA